MMSSNGTTRPPGALPQRRSPSIAQASSAHEARMARFSLSVRSASFTTWLGCWHPRSKASRVERASALRPDPVLRLRCIQPFAHCLYLLSRQAGLRRRAGPPRCSAASAARQDAMRIGSAGLSIVRLLSLARLAVPVPVPVRYVFSPSPPELPPPPDRSAEACSRPHGSSTSTWSSRLNLPLEGTGGDVRP